MRQSGLEFASYFGAIRGARPYQEDCANIWRPNGEHGPGDGRPLLGVLSDGMGGHVSGEVASKLACSNYARTFSGQAGPIDQRLDASLQASNSALSDAIRSNTALNGMGCTLVAGYIDQDGLRWVSVGDSMLLLYRDGQLRRLNEDHSFGALLDKQAAARKISEEEARNNPRRRSLRSALTGGQIALRHLEAQPRRLLPGDWILMASDGLETLSGTQIAKLIRAQENASPQRLVEQLLDAVAARKVENQDNTTILAIKVVDPNEQPTLIIERSGAPVAAGDFETAGAPAADFLDEQHMSLFDRSEASPAQSQWAVPGTVAARAAMGTAVAATAILAAWLLWEKTPAQPDASTAAGITQPAPDAGAPNTEGSPKAEIAPPPPTDKSNDDAEKQEAQPPLVAPPPAPTPHQPVSGPPANPDKPDGWIQTSPPPADSKPKPGPKTGGKASPPAPRGPPSQAKEPKAQPAPATEPNSFFSTPAGPTQTAPGSGPAGPSATMPPSAAAPPAKPTEPSPAAKGK